jgi:hypothetical protein
MEYLERVIQEQDQRIQELVERLRSTKTTVPDAPGRNPPRPAIS